MKSKKDEQRLHVLFAGTGVFAKTVGLKHERRRRRRKSPSVDDVVPAQQSGNDRRKLLTNVLTGSTMNELLEGGCAI